MATVQRNVKTYGNRNFVGEVASAPSHYAPVLSNEVDADLDTIYAAWNGGADSVNIKDGSITYAKLAPDAQLWRDTGTTLTQGTNYTGRSVQVLTNLYVGAATVTTLLQTGAGPNTYLACNYAYTPQDATKPSWGLNLDLNADTCIVHRRAANAASGAVTNLLSIDASGNLLVVGNFTMGASGPATYDRPGVRICGATAGGRYQNVGTAAGTDGYSNAIAFGWDGAVVRLRVDSTQIGAVNTTPSDARIKRAVEDDCPGLDAVCALRPITFEYDQTKREIGFPTGRQYGLIAQEAQPHVGAVIDDDRSDERYLGINYAALVPVLIQAIKDLAARVTVVETAAA